MLLTPDNRARFKSLVPLIVPLDSRDDRCGVAKHLCGVCDQVAEVRLDPSFPKVAELSKGDDQRWARFRKLYVKHLTALPKPSIPFRSVPVLEDPCALEQLP